MVSTQITWFGAAFLAVWILGLSIPSVRQAWLNGWRCLMRHPALWKIPAGLSLAYSLFQIIGWLGLHWRVGQMPDLDLPASAPPVPLPADNILPALETLAADLNCLVATFPLSAFCGFLFLINYRRLSTELRRALCKRFGGSIGWTLFVLLTLCAASALLKPLPLLVLPELASILPAQELLLAASIVNALSFVFEYLLGTCVQTGLLLVAYGWVRGLNFPRARLLHFSVRRLAFVLKWAVVIIAAALLLIHLPLIAEIWLTGEPGAWQITGFTDTFTRPALAVFMLAMATVQIHLAFHNDSLRGAFAAHAGFLRRHVLSLPIFLATAFLLLLPLASLHAAGAAWLGQTLWAQAWTLVAQTAIAALGGWILAAWVCFYKSCEAPAKPISF